MRGDRPIESAGEDRLGRAPFAKAMAAQILEAPALDSYVVAIMGPWGSGKTSIVGGALKEAAEIAKTAGEALAEPPSVEAQRDKIREQLKGQAQRIVVLVDDIDRLRRDEIREVVKLVRLTGDFPNIVYVLAFDRGRIEAALGDDDESGRAYLEKIVQVSYDVPVAQEADVVKLFLDELNAAMTGIEHGPFEQSDWNDIFAFVVQPLLRSPRDVRRYINALPPTLRVIGHEVAWGRSSETAAFRSSRLFGDRERLR